MKKLDFWLRAGALGTVLAFAVPQVLPAPRMMSAPVARAATDWDAMDEDELAEHLGEMSAEAVIAVMRDEDLDDPDIQSDVEGEIWERAEKAGCDHLLDLRAVGDIRLEERGLAAGRLDGRLRLLCLRGVARVVDGDMRALGCEPQRDGAADAAGRARDKRGLSI